MLCDVRHDVAITVSTGLRGTQSRLCDSITRLLGFMRMATDVEHVYSRISIEWDSQSGEEEGAVVK